MVSELFDESKWRAVAGFDFRDITYHRALDHGTVRIAFDRPEVRNAFRPQTVDELYRALDHARMTSDVGWLLLTGNGPSPRDGVWSFCSGGDQRIRGRDGYRYADGDNADSIDPGRTGRLHILEVQRLIRFMPKVVICVVPGWAAGGGHSFFLGLEYSADDAYQMGMVNAVVAHADLEAAALRWAALVNGKSPTAQRMLKFAFNLVDDGLVGQQLFAGEATRLAYMTEEAAEGRDSFLEKRPADWSSFPWHF